MCVVCALMFCMSARRLLDVMKEHWCVLFVVCVACCVCRVCARVLCMP